MKKRKLLSILVCLALAMAMLPAAAFADDAAVSSSDQAQVTQPSTVISTDNAQDWTEPSVDSGPAATTPTGSAATAPTNPAATASTDPAATAPTDPAATAPTDSAATAPTDELAANPQEETTDPQESQPPSDTQPSEAALSKALPAAKVGSDLEATDAAVSSSPVKSAKTAAATVAKVTNTAAGIKISGGTEGKDWTYDPQGQTLIIMKDGITVTGTATDNLAILCTLAVTTITLDSLNNNGHVVALTSVDLDGMGSKMTDLTIRLKGNNKLDLIMGLGNISLVGTKNSKLELSIGAVTLNDLNIKDAAVSGGIFAAMRDMNISGKSVVTAKATKYTKPFMELGVLPAMITAGRDINVDLAPGGSVSSKGAKVKNGLLFDQVLPLMAGRNINLSDSSKVVLPNGGKVGAIKLLGVFDAAAIVDANGNPAVDAVIKNTSDLSAAAAAGSPQTGDNSAALGYLYLILLVAGATALISRKKESQSR